jgi:mRNA-degrading endonuclease RelE of RelBE toxin-antitoxin system
VRAPFEGYWSARRGTYQVRDRIDDKHAVIVLDAITTR